MQEVDERIIPVKAKPVDVILCLVIDFLVRIYDQLTRRPKPARIAGNPAH